MTGKTVVGFAGSFYGYEGLDLLIDALALLAPRHPDLRVLLVGGGMQEAALREQARVRGVADRVVFSGRVPHQEVQRYYDLIDVLAYPRHRMRLTELVTPLKPLEAMAQGRMLVASDVGGHRELIRDGETGVLFPAGDARRARRRDPGGAGATRRLAAVPGPRAPLRRDRADVGAQRRALRGGVRAARRRRPRSGADLQRARRET